MNTAVEPVVIALGSNLDAPLQQIEQAFARLGAIAGTSGWRLSPVFRTPPWGVTAQPDFANAIAIGACTLAPVALLRHLQAIEAALGRVRDGTRNGPRRIDLDLIAFGARRFMADGLEVPHPRAHDRAFVLGPWHALDPAARLPDGIDVASAWLRLPEADRQGLKPWPEEAASRR